MGAVTGFKYGVMVQVATPEIFVSMSLKLDQLSRQKKNTPLFPKGCLIYKGLLDMKSENLF